MNGIATKVKAAYVRPIAAFNGAGLRTTTVRFVKALGGIVCDWCLTGRNGRGRRPIIQCMRCRWLVCSHGLSFEAGGPVCQACK